MCYQPGKSESESNSAAESHTHSCPVIRTIYFLNIDSLLVQSEPVSDWNTLFSGRTLTSRRAQLAASTSSGETWTSLKPFCLQLSLRQEHGGNRVYVVKPWSSPLRYRPTEQAELPQWNDTFNLHSICFRPDVERCKRITLMCRDLPTKTSSASSHEGNEVSDEVRPLYLFTVWFLEEKNQLKWFLQ